MAALQVGDQAPEFTATAHTGETISLADFRGRKSVVLYFYPRDGTTICTREACGFRDDHARFAEAGAVVIGVSSNSLDEHRKFAAEQQLPFLLVSDADGQLRRAFGVGDLLGLLPQRVTFVIDPQGVVRHVFSGLFVARRHIDEALDTVRRLRA